MPFSYSRNSIQINSSNVGGGTPGRVLFISPSGLLTDVAGFSFASGTQTVSTINLTGGQILFPAVQNPSANVNAIDDAERGTWTPASNGTATYTKQSGSYVKIGQFVHTEFDLDINAIGTGDPTRVFGFPFTNSARTSPGVLAYFANIATASSWVGIYLTTGATSANFTNTVVAAATATNVPAIHANGSTVTGALDYRASA